MERDMAFASQAGERRRSRSGGKRGFSLVELLVTIAILALLIGILLPAVKRAREVGRDATCQSNLKQIGISVVAYSVDHYGRMPDSGSDGSKGDLTGTLERYLNQPWGVGIWRCPSHDGFVEGTHTASYGYNWQYLLEEGPDYPHTGWNGFMNPGILFEDLHRPSDTISFIDHHPPEGMYHLWSYVQRPGDTDPISGFGRPQFRHEGHADALFCDGHSAAVDPHVGTTASEPKSWDPR